jgi:Glycoside-hydrolase family GH114
VRRSPVYDARPLFYARPESADQYRECRKYRPFITAEKAVLETEYELNRSRFCPKARRLDLSAIRKRLRLGAWRRACPRLSYQPLPARAAAGSNRAISTRVASIARV